MSYRFGHFGLLCIFIILLKGRKQKTKEVCNLVFLGGGGFWNKLSWSPLLRPDSSAGAAQVLWVELAQGLHSPTPTQSVDKHRAGGGALRKPGRGGADLLPGPVRFQPFPAQEPCVSAGGRVLLTQTTGPYHRSGTWQAEGREAEGGRGQAAWWPQRITAYCEQTPLGLGLVGMLKGDFSALLKAKCGLA